MKNYLLYGYFQGYSPETILETDEVFHLIFLEEKKKNVFSITEMYWMYIIYKLEPPKL